jgi:hypothetical protein
MRGAAAQGPLPIVLLWTPPLSKTQAEVIQRRIEILIGHSALPETDWMASLRGWLGAAVQRATARA